MEDSTGLKLQIFESVGFPGTIMKSGMIELKAKDSGSNPGTPGH